LLDRDWIARRFMTIACLRVGSQRPVDTAEPHGANYLLTPAMSDGKALTN
jgi:hypothetical protein